MKDDFIYKYYNAIANRNAKKQSFFIVSPAIKLDISKCCYVVV